MIRVFGDSDLKYHHESIRRSAMLFGAIAFAWFIASFLLVFFRHMIGRELSMIVGISITAVFFSFSVEMLRLKVLPEIRLSNVVRALKQNEHREMEGQIAGVSPQTTTKFGQTFWVVSLRQNESTPSQMVDLYFWAFSTCPVPAVNTRVHMYLSENIVMGCEIC